MRLELVPRYPLARRRAAAAARAAGARSGEIGYLAYRTDGVDAQFGGVFRINKVEPIVFAQHWPASLALDPATLAFACSFRREEGQSPELRLRLRPRPPTVQAVQDVTVRAGTRQSEIRATLTARKSDASAGKGLALVEWDVQWPPPQLTVIAVSGPGVYGWSQNGPRVQVWLERSVDAVKLELTARLTGPPGKEGTLELPALRLVTAQTQQTTVRRCGRAGPDARAGRQLAAQPDAGGQCAQRPAPRPSLHHRPAVLRRRVDRPPGRVRRLGEGPHRRRRP